VPTTEKQTQPSEQLAQNIINLQGVTVLCLENDPNLLAALVALLESWQCKILACDNTQKALSYYREYNDDIDIMLMDYQLSESTTGLEFMLQISKASSHGIPGVLLTAAADTDLPYRVEEAGFSFMKKPMKPAALRALISAILTQKMQQNYSLLEENDDEPISN
jgi:DNA-binding response OmpR family regulator